MQPKFRHGVVTLKMWSNVAGPQAFATELRTIADAIEGGSLAGNPVMVQGYYRYDPDTTVEDGDDHGR